MTAIEWVYKNLLENPISNQDIEYNKAEKVNVKNANESVITRPTIL